ncbi:MAG TPA: DUF58 domain-containing protein [Solirubrobacteraceae bacterium]|nr:DUF58 domain-containing protein [Solirubrobacteraceae bacterium]
MTRCASPRLILYAGLAAVGLLGALASGRAEPVVLAAPFAVLVAVALAAVRAPVVSVAFSLSEDRVLEGARVQALLELTAQTTIERFDFVVAIAPELAPEPRPRARATRLLAGQTARFEFVLHASRWGAYDLGSVKFRAHDSFGLISFSGEADCGVPLRVYPEIEPLRSLVTPLRTRPFPGSQIARANGEGIEFADIRPFQHGDQPRRINWRASARAGSLLLTDSRPEHTSDVILLLDGYADVRHAQAGTLDALVRAAASLAHAHLARRDRVGVITFGTEVAWLTPASGDRQLYQIVEALIETAVERSYRRHDIDRLPPRTLPARALVIAITPLADPRMVAVLFDLRARGFDVAALEISPLPHLAQPHDPASALAQRLWVLSRDAVRYRLEHRGIPVAEVGVGLGVADSIEEVRAYRRFALGARVR